MYLSNSVTAAALLVAANSVAAIRCDDFQDRISNQADIDAFKACSKTETYFFTIAHNFTGPFVMDHVESLPEFLNGYLGPKIRGDDREDDKVTSVSMPDLKTVHGRGILFGYMDNLTSISLPKLKTVDSELVVVGSDNVKALSFPSLETVGKGIYLDGWFDTVEFPSLQSAAYLKLLGSSKLNCTTLGHALANVNFTGNSITGYNGFTCWTPNENNRWNSSDPDHNPDPANPVASTQPVASSRPTHSENSANPPSSTNSAKPDGSNNKSSADTLTIGYSFVPMLVLMTLLNL